MSDWLAAFRAMHEQAKAGALAPDALDEYRAGRDELARALLAAQRVTIKAGEVPRRALRVSRALQADLTFPAEQVRGMTLDICVGGFGMLLARRPSAPDGKFSLRMPGGDPLTGSMHLVDARVQPGNVRVAFTFIGLSADEQERLECFVFDTVLAQVVRGK